jgi:hypothetical protein
METYRILGPGTPFTDAVGTGHRFTKTRQALTPQESASGRRASLMKSLLSAVLVSLPSHAGLVNPVGAICYSS